MNFGMIAGPYLVQYSNDHHLSPIVSIAVLRLIFGTIPVFAFEEKKIVLEVE
jgi:hypothetical protein